jgi:hypothetical protein
MFKAEARTQYRLILLENQDAENKKIKQKSVKTLHAVIT